MSALWRTIKKNWKNIILLCLAFAMGLTGVILVVKTTSESEDTLYSMHEVHLRNLLNSIDHNTKIVVDQCYSALTLFVTRPDVCAAESALLDGDSTPLSALIAQTDLIEVMNGVLVTNAAGDVLVAVGDVSTETYTFLQTDSEKHTWMITFDDASVHFALSQASAGGQFTYFALIDPAVAYELIVTEDVYRNCWVLFHNQASQMFWLNEGTTPVCYIMSDEEALQRDDGFSSMVAFEQADQKGTRRYVYRPSEGESESIYILVYPNSLTKNNLFSIGVALYDASLLDVIRHLNMTGLFGAALVALSSFLFILFIRMNNKKRREMHKELALLKHKSFLSAKLLEQQQTLAHHQKLETIGTMTAGISHEFNNLLTPIMGNSMLLLEHLPEEGSEMYESAIAIYEASAKAKKLIKQLSVLSRKSPGRDLTDIYPNALITETIHMMGTTIPKHIHVVVESACGESDVFSGDEGQMSHVLINLIINAYQAMGDTEGTLTVRSETVGDTIRILVSDTGPGIPADVLPRLFDPFFTTKDPGKGTGLGLPIVQTTVQTHGGTIEASNIPGSGARFTITLPRKESIL